MNFYQFKASVKSILSTRDIFKWLNWLSFGIGFWFLLYPHPYQLLFIVLLLIPIVGIIANGYLRSGIASLINIGSIERKEKPSVPYFITLPGLSMLIRMLTDYQWENFLTILKVGTIGFALMLCLLFATNRIIEKANSERFWIYVIIISNIACYSYSCTYGLNCAFDNSDPKVYVTKVIEKSTSGTKGKRFNLEVVAWGNHPSGNISVAPSQYANTEVGQTVKVDLKKGLFGIAWYYIE